MSKLKQGTVLENNREVMEKWCRFIFLVSVPLFCADFANWALNSTCLNEIRVLIGSNARDLKAVYERSMGFLPGLGFPNHITFGMFDIVELLWKI